MTDAPNALYPDWERPTPVDLVVKLTRAQREQRVERLIDIARARYDEALAVHGAGKEIVAVASLTSGGNDSYTVARLFREELTHMVHANTGTGIEATREHVRDTAAAWGLPLLEVRPPEGQGYRELVLGEVTARSRATGERVRVWPGGFPGPAGHPLMYQRLKERALDRVPHELGISRSRTRRVVFIAGRRRAESAARADVPHHEAQGTVIWASPITVWHKADLRTYRLMVGDVPVNPVAQVLGMSGECGCLANAKPGERARWFEAFPNDPFLIEVLELERLLADRSDVDDRYKTWGHGTRGSDRRAKEGRLCGRDCGPDPLLDLMDPLFELDGAVSA